MKRTKDDGVSSVVAVMLVLSVLVIGVTLFMGTYLPDMKAASEIQNSEDIRGTFMNYASYVDNTYSTRQVGQYSWIIQLGAGDLIISPSKSSGILELHPETEFVTVSSDTGIIPPITCYSMDMTYTPSMTYWRNIGYLYSKGVVTVTNSLKNIDYLTVSDASQKGYLYDENTQTLTLIDWLIDGSTSKSGSGPASLSLKMTLDTSLSNDYEITEDTKVTITSSLRDGSTEIKEIDLPAETIFKVIVLTATVTLQ